MNYTKEQIFEIISKHAEQRNGPNDLLSIMLESMMMAERGEFLQGMMEDDITDYDYLSQRSRCRGWMYGTYQG